MIKMGGLFLLPLALLLVAPLAAAADTDNGKYLSGAYDAAKCLTDFENSVISAVTTAVPQASNLSAYSDKLTADTGQLQVYADAGDAESFRSYLRGTYEPDVRSANQAIRDARTNFRDWNVTAQAKKDMLDSYKSAKDAQTSCHLSAVKGMGQGRVQHYESELQKWTDKADNLSAKGIDTSGMMSVISGARDVIVTPLQNALDSATSGKEVADAVQGYCLADGCNKGINYHFYAKIEAAKTQAILDYVKPNATAAGLTGQVDAAQADLDTVQGTLASVGTSKYTSGQQATVWGSLKDAAKEIKGIMKALRGNQTAGG